MSLRRKLLIVALWPGVLFWLGVGLLLIRLGMALEEKAGEVTE